MAGRDPAGLAQQRRLADARLAAHHERTTAVARRFHEVGEAPRLVLTPEERRAGTVDRHCHPSLAATGTILPNPPGRRQTLNPVT
ncbi:hypothetical protein GCM10010170_070990 [Dactylosporangium salmoneum]|uniref:Uncharacterized protein n=1 Tax=Dactylosporangium salmoneum TaxID=53361 RepID=A0ABP5U567_9ACTN